MVWKFVSSPPSYCSSPSARSWEISGSFTTRSEICICRQVVAGGGSPALHAMSPTAAVTVRSPVVGIVVVVVVVDDVVVDDDVEVVDEDEDVVDEEVVDDDVEVVDADVVVDGSPVVTIS